VEEVAAAVTRGPHEFHSPLLALLQEAENILKEAEKEVLVRREKVSNFLLPSPSRQRTSSRRRRKKHLCDGRK
jgi:hypothetical protein